MIQMRALIIFALLLLSLSSTAQTEPDTLNWYRGTVDGTDTMAVVNLGYAVVSNNEHYAWRYQKRYFKLERKVLKVYPYALAAGELMNKYEAKLNELETERARKKYLKIAEEDLKKEFEGQIREMTISEGMILIKLIDRQTGDTSYELIKELRGSFSAFLWQSVARIFGNNLKDEYDPSTDDRMIEDIIQRIESGDLKLPKKDPKEKD